MSFSISLSLAPLPHPHAFPPAPPGRHALLRQGKSSHHGVYIRYNPLFINVLNRYQDDSHIEPYSRRKLKKHPVKYVF